MKKTIGFVTILFVLITVLSMVACNERDVWADATYTEDTTLGEGKTQVSVVIEAQERRVILTVRTDKEKLGDALFELGIINDAVFFDTANGMKLDWNTDKAYWGFYQKGELMMYGVNDEVISNGETYELVYTKG